MPFESKKEVLDWYERQERTLTPEFIDSIAWNEVREHPLDPTLVPVLFYMRDVESLTAMYYSELRRTPTGKDPHISKFMERWGVEETTHGELLDRFLNAAGYETDRKWQEQVRRAVSRTYRANTYLITSLTNLIGRKFTATHMTFGAVHEMSTTQGYRRLIRLAKHPVLTRLLEGIIREESAHTTFYLNVARLELRQNELARRIARFVVDHFWTPVGQGSIPKRRTHYTINKLFADTEGMACFDKTVSQRIEQLPGFAGLRVIKKTIRRGALTASGLDDLSDLFGVTAPYNRLPPSSSAA
ncbi:MAG: acyl-ACP desaturase [Pyrinomonadaceae bacterium]